MPFIQRVVKPEFVSRSFGKKAGLASISDDNNSNGVKYEREFESITNVTLSNALRQMASVVIIANDIFLELNTELQKIGNRTKSIKERIYVLENNVSKFDPKEVEVPESDFETFVQIKDHFKINLTYDKELFVKNTRPINVQNLYEAAGKSPISDFVDSAGDENITSRGLNVDDQTLFLNCLSFDQKKHKVNAEIEIQLPEAIAQLRKWTSTEALGEVTVTPDCISKVGSFNEDETEITSVFPSTYTKFSDLPGIGDNIDTSIDHRLPSPEEQCQLIATKYPAEIISVDVTGRRFQRMCLARKSVYAVENKHTDNNNSKDETEKKCRLKKSRTKRRNTVIGIDPKEISEAIQGNILPFKSSNDLSTIESISEKSKSSDLRTVEPSTTNESCKSTLGPLNSLKIWGRNRLKLSDRFSDDKKNKNFREAKSEIEKSSVTTTISNKNKKKFFEKGKQYFSINENNKNSDKNITINYFKSDSTSNSPESIKNNDNPSSSSSSVKLRESSSLRRQRRNDLNHKDDPPHSSSGNWSASSESGRASIGSEVTILPKSSASSISLNHNNNNSSYQSFGTGPPSSIISRRRFLNTSASSSVTSEGPSTPDPQIMNDISFIDDETSSSYSCDTEGYYTSFHIDSGLKTLREEEPATPLYSTSALSSNNSIGTLFNQNGENEYDLFGRGSTSTTASSAGTVCTTLLLQNENDLNVIQFGEITENKLSYSSSNCSSSTAVSTLERCATIKRNSKVLHPPKELTEVTVHLEKLEANEINNDLKNSNINNNNNNGKNKQQSEAATKYELDCAEYSDVESVDRSERIRQKTAISSSRIPSMCIITPTTSDDENSRSVKTSKINRDVQYPIPKTDNTNECIDDNINIKIHENDKNQHKILDFTKSDPQKSIIKDENIESLYDNPLNESFEKNSNTSDNLDIEISFDKNIYHTIGEYVTLAEVSNKNKMSTNNNHNNNNKHNNTKTIVGNSGIYYSKNNIKNKNASTSKPDNSLLNNETEYISLKELPCNLTKTNHQTFPFGVNNVDNESQSQQKLTKTNDNKTMNKQSAEIESNSSNSNTKCMSTLQRNSNDMRIAFNAQGKIIYNSDSLRRQKNRGHSTFLPGPYVKDSDKVHQISSSESNDKEINNDPENDCYVQLIDNKTIKSKFMSGGCVNRPTKPIRPVRTIASELTKSNITNQKIKMSTEENAMYQKGNNESKISANEEIQQHRDFQNLLHKTHEPFNRNAQIYGTLPRKDSSFRNIKIMSPKVLPSKSSIYNSSNLPSQLALSPIIPCDNKGSFRTSTPSKLAEISVSSNEINPPKYLRNKSNNNANNIEEIPKVCSDRMGTAKTSLMDFKKLLLAKSTKNVVHKLSAVEMLKVAKENAIKDNKSSVNTNFVNKPQGTVNSSLNSNMLLLDLSRSPRSFANRRMIRQGQFGSPSKYNIVGKKRVYGISNTIGTDVISTTIPETNKEDDSASSSGSIGSQKSIERNQKSVSDEHIDLKNNFFLQAEENNFMKSEIDKSKYRTQLAQYRQDLTKTAKTDVNNKNAARKMLSTQFKENILKDAAAPTTINKTPSFETSL